MKNKFQRMNKEEKKELIIRYKTTDKGKKMNIILIRLFIIGILGILSSFASFGYSYGINRVNIWDYISSGVIIVISVIFLYQSLKIRGTEYNKFAIKEKK